MKENNTKFDISKVISKLPLSYQKLMSKTFLMTDEIENRTATFENYNSSSSRCHHFYKPISKLNYE